LPAYNAKYTKIGNMCENTKMDSTNYLDKIYTQLNKRICSKDYTFNDLYLVGRYDFNTLYNILSDHARADSGIFLETFIQ
jgi:hypothetical protein